MIRSRITLIVMILALLFGTLGLVGCSSDDAADDTETAAEETDATEETGDAEAGAAIAGTWDNADAYYYPSITFNADGTGMISDIDGEEAEMEWTLVDDYLEISLEYDGMSEMTGGGFTWTEEGAEFSWDADGTYTKAE